MSSGDLAGGNQTAICTICFEDLKPIVEDLQSIPICGHVFHELCIQQWMEYCKNGKRPTCPVCKQSCLKSELTRLYFQSTSEQSQSGSCVKRREMDAKELEKEVRRLEGKASALAETLENLQDSIKKMVKELSAWKELAKKEETRKEELKKEKERTELHLKMKTEELSRTSTECTKLKETNLGLAKELAALKLATDVNLEEEDMVKLASLGRANNPENVIDVLKKSLSLRNKSYKELMAQCNLLGRSDTRARKKLDKYKEKINKLSIRLQELEKALEAKENEVLRNLKSSTKDHACRPMEEIMSKPNQINFSINYSDNLKRSATYLETTSRAFKENRSVVDLETYSCFMEEENLTPSPRINEHQISDSDFHKSPVPAQKTVSLTNGEGSSINMKRDMKDITGIILSRKVTQIASSTLTAETLVMDDISKRTPSLAMKGEAQTYDSAASSGGLFGSEGANKTIGKWCKSSSVKMASSNGDLISVGSDGRGGRVKVLRDHDQTLDEKTKTLWPKKLKHGVQRSGQFHMEHFFAKTES